MSQERLSNNNLQFKQIFTPKTTKKYPNLPRAAVQSSLGFSSSFDKPNQIKKSSSLSKIPSFSLIPEIDHQLKRLDTLVTFEKSDNILISLSNAIDQLLENSKHCPYCFQKSFTVQNTKPEVSPPHGFIQELKTVNELKFNLKKSENALKQKEKDLESLKIKLENEASNLEIKTFEISEEKNKIEIERSLLEAESNRLKDEKLKMSFMLKKLDNKYIDVQKLFVSSPTNNQVSKEKDLRMLEEKLKAEKIDVDIKNEVLSRVALELSKKEDAQKEKSQELEKLEVKLKELKKEIEEKEKKLYRIFEEKIKHVKSIELKLKNKKIEVKAKLKEINVQLGKLDEIKFSLPKKIKESIFAEKDVESQ